MDAKPIRRGLARRCPRCGAPGIMASLHELHERCPGCGFVFVREDGYWLGAMVVIMALVEGAFAVLLVSVLALTWPDVPWTPLLAAGVLLNLAVPLLGYGYAKSVWVALHYAFDPTTGDDGR